MRSSQSKTATAGSQRIHHEPSMSAQVSLACICLPPHRFPNASFQTIPSIASSGPFHRCPNEKRRLLLDRGNPPFIAAKTNSAAATIAVGLRLKVVRFVSVRLADMVELLQRVHFSIATLPRLLFVKEIERHFSCLEFQ